MFLWPFSRDELLSIVRKHSSFLKNHLVSGEGNNEEEDHLDMRFWRELVDMFFVKGMIDLKETQGDDLVFFVQHEVLYYFLPFPQDICQQMMKKSLIVDALCRLIIQVIIMCNLILSADGHPKYVFVNSNEKLNWFNTRWIFVITFNISMGMYMYCPSHWCYDLFIFYNMAIMCLPNFAALNISIKGGFKARILFGKLKFDMGKINCLSKIAYA